MQPVLVDRRELAAQALVEIIDDFGIALHGCTPVFQGQRRLETVFRTLLNQFMAKGNLTAKKAVELQVQRILTDFQQAASANAWVTSWAGSSFAA